MAFETEQRKCGPCFSLPGCFFGFLFFSFFLFLVFLARSRVAAGARPVDHLAVFCHSVYSVPCRAVWWLSQKLGWTCATSPAGLWVGKGKKINKGEARYRRSRHQLSRRADIEEPVLKVCERKCIYMKNNEEQHNGAGYTCDWQFFFKSKTQEGKRGQMQ